MSSRDIVNESSNQIALKTVLVLNLGASETALPSSFLMTKTLSCVIFRDQTYEFFKSTGKENKKIGGLWQSALR